MPDPTINKDSLVNTANPALSELQRKSIELHKAAHGKLRIESRMPLDTKEALSLAYSPGVAGPCKAIEHDARQFQHLTSAARTVAVISDGTAVLGLGDLGPKAAMPVMEGKAALFKAFAGVDAFPIVLDTQDTDEIINTIVRIAPSFGGINLEDISAPRCFEIEERLHNILNIPVFHDDQHGTAIVVLAGLINALKVTGRSDAHTEKAAIRIVISGAGAAGVAIATLLHAWGARHIVVTDSQGIISRTRTDLNPVKQALLNITNPENQHGSLEDAVQQADVFIGVSVANVLAPKAIQTMNQQPIIFALANPDPEVDPIGARENGAAIVATGRSDLPNQINNVLAFPGVFKGLLDARIERVTTPMKMAAAHAIAACVINPSPERIVPSPFAEGIADHVAHAIITTHRDA